MHLEISIQTGGDTAVYNEFDYDMTEQREAELMQEKLAKERLAFEDANAPPDIKTDIVSEVVTPKKKQLQRDIKAAALERLEQAAKTPEDFKVIIKRWDNLDENRERKERYWEICRNNEDFPLEWCEASWGTVFPKNLNTITAKQIRNGDFIDVIFDNPYDIHELVTEDYLCKILKGLKDEHKELLYLLAIKGYSTKEIEKIQGKSDRAVRYMRETVFNKIRKEAYKFLTSEQGKNHDMTLAEKKFVENYKKNE